MKSSRRVLLAAGALTALAAVPSLAGAVITPTNNATALARAIADRPNTVVGAEFVHRPMNSGAALSTTRLGQFPTSGPRFAILSNGDPRLAAAPNNSPGTGVDLGGPVVRGARDVTTLRVDMNVPQNARCLSVRFRFYSEEFPEWVGTPFNDAFIAELDRTTWDATGGAGVSAPDNFAFDVQRRPVAVNSIGPTSVAPARAADTTYDAATRRLRASVPVTPGRHSLYLTILDQGDQVFDSSVFIDRLTLSNLTPCTPGAAVDVAPGRPPGAIQLKTGRFSIPATSVFGSAARLVVQGVAYRPNPVRIGRSTNFRVRIRDTRGFVVRGARVQLESFPKGLFRPVGEVTTRNNGQVNVNLRTRPGAVRPPNGEAWVFVKALKPGGSDSDRVTGSRLIKVNVRG